MIPLNEAMKSAPFVKGEFVEKGDFPGHPFRGNQYASEAHADTPFADFWNVLRGRDPNAGLRTVNFNFREYTTDPMRNLMESRLHDFGRETKLSNLHGFAFITRGGTVIRVPQHIDGFRAVFGDRFQREDMRPALRAMGWLQVSQKGGLFSFECGSELTPQQEKVVSSYLHGLDPHMNVSWFDHTSGDMGRGKDTLAAMLSEPVRKGDFEGHPFRGNQYKDSGGGTGVLVEEYTQDFDFSTITPAQRREADKALKEYGKITTLAELNGSAFITQDGNVVQVHTHEDALSAAFGEKYLRYSGEDFYNAIKHVGWVRVGKYYNHFYMDRTSELSAKQEDVVLSFLHARGDNLSVTWNDWTRKGQNSGHDKESLMEMLFEPVAKGEGPGHPFRGNQYTDEEGGSEKELEPLPPKLFDRGVFRKPKKFGNGSWAYKTFSEGYCETDARRIEEGAPKEVLERHHETMERIQEALEGAKRVNPPKDAVVKDYGPRTGLCYEMAARFVRDNPTWSVVHATLYPQIGDFVNSVYLHGFAEKDNVIFDPVVNAFYDRESYYKYYAITDVRKFSATQARRLMGRTRHWGSWDAD